MSFLIPYHFPDRMGGGQDTDRVPAKNRVCVIICFRGGPLRVRRLHQSSIVRDHRPADSPVSRTVSYHIHNGLFSGHLVPIPPMSGTPAPAAGMMGPACRSCPHLLVRTYLAPLRAAGGTGQDPRPTPVTDPLAVHRNAHRASAGQAGLPDLAGHEYLPHMYESLAIIERRSVCTPGVMEG